MQKWLIIYVPLALGIFFGCSAHRQEVALRLHHAAFDRTPESLVMEDVLQKDKALRRKDRQLHDVNFLHQPGSDHTEFVAMTSAIGPQGRWGAPYTWLYKVKAPNGTKRLFKLPLEARVIGKGNPPLVAGYYWAYQCVVCDQPSQGYVVRIPVVAKLKGKGRRWHLVPTGKKNTLQYLEREAKLVVKTAKEKYGRRNKIARRMGKQLKTLFAQKPFKTPSSLQTVSRSLPQVSY